MLQKKVVALQQDIDGKDFQIRNQEEELNAKTNEKNEIIEMLRGQKHECEKQTLDIERMKAEVEAKETKIKELTKEIERIRRARDGDKTSHVNEIQRRDIQIRELKEEVEKLTQNRNSGNSSIQKLEYEL